MTAPLPTTAEFLHPICRELCQLYEQAGYVPCERGECIMNGRKLPGKTISFSFVNDPKSFNASEDCGVI